MDVVLKKRTDAQNVAVRLAVKVGLRNFSCLKRETLYFLERLLFMGTSKHGEADLQRSIEDNEDYESNDSIAIIMFDIVASLKTLASSATLQLR